MKRLGVTLAVALVALTAALPAFAKDFVQDGAGLFSAGTIAQLNSRIGNFNAQTGKEVVVVTVPSLNGSTLQNAAGSVFSEQQVNGVLIFISKDDRRDIIVPGRATAQFFPADTTRSIRESMESQFKNGDFDGGITTAVGGVLDVFRAHMNSMPNANGGYNRVPATRSAYPATGGFHLSMFWWIIIIVVGFLVLRSIMRSMSAPRYYGGGPATPGGPGGPGYGGPGYGGGYYGGGGGFWSGLLGGLGGAWLGNEMFGNRGGGNIVDQGGGYGGGSDQGGGWGGGSGDSGGWGSDAGQADFGSSSSGDFSGGGFGGGDGGGGGGDSGGGW